MLNAAPSAVEYVYPSSYPSTFSSVQQAWRLSLKPLLSRQPLPLCGECGGCNKRACREFLNWRAGEPSTKQGLKATHKGKGSRGHATSFRRTNRAEEKRSVCFVTMGVDASGAAVGQREKSQVSLCSRQM